MKEELEFGKVKNVKITGVKFSKIDPKIVEKLCKIEDGII